MKRSNTLVLSYFAFGLALAACGDVSPSGASKSGTSGSDSSAGGQGVTGTTTGGSGTTGGSTAEGGLGNPACPTGYVCTPAPTPGATSVASQIQQTVGSLVSDGTTLFWASSEGGPLSSVPVNGGTISTVVPAPVGQVVAVDGTNVYYLPDSGVLTRTAKGGGGTPAPVGDATSSMESVTVLGTNAYWIERVGGGPVGGGLTIMSASLQSGSATVLTTVNPANAIQPVLGVTATTGFVGGLGASSVTSFPITPGVPDSGAGTTVAGVSQGCSFFASDTNAAYCGEYGSSVLAIASNDTPTTLGTVLGEGTVADGSGLAFDDTDVYWVDAVVVGTIMKAPKTGGTATIVARDTSPLALAVDANAIYWSDVGGNIMRLPK